LVNRAFPALDWLPLKARGAADRMLAVVALLVIVALPAVEVIHEECDAGVLELTMPPLFVMCGTARGRRKGEQSFATAACGALNKPPLLMSRGIARARGAIEKC